MESLLNLKHIAKSFLNDKMAANVTKLKTSQDPRFTRGDVAKLKKLPV